MLAGWGDWVAADLGVGGLVGLGWGLSSACQLFRRITWKIQNETTYNFYLFCLEGLGFGVWGLGYGVWGFRA